ncbi:MAG: c-type cytochrome, partial [Deltaproteobacteria bacterium]|nr:c-type cytochrome [Deltaproteobacteria bacterium]
RPPSAPPGESCPHALSASEKAGSDLFQSKGCLACHKVGANGGSIGPDLSGQGLKGRSRDWLSTQLVNPKAHNSSSVMPAQASLSPDAIGQLIDYLQSLKQPVSAAAAAAPPAAASAGPRGAPGAAVAIIGSADHGAILFEKTCVSCHGREGKGQVANPGSAQGVVPSLNPIDADEASPDPRTFAEKIDRYLQHGSRPEGPNPALTMLPFGDTHALTQAQIADLEAYILNLNGVDRAKINNPGVSPDIFLIIAAFVFALVYLNLFGWWWFGGLRKQREEGENE